MFITREQLANLAYDLKELYEDLQDIIDAAMNEAEIDEEMELENRDD